MDQKGLNLNAPKLQLPQLTFDFARSAGNNMILRVCVFYMQRFSFLCLCVLGFQPRVVAE